MKENKLKTIGSNIYKYLLDIIGSIFGYIFGILLLIIVITGYAFFYNPVQFTNTLDIVGVETRDYMENNRNLVWCNNIYWENTCNNYQEFKCDKIQGGLCVQK